MRNYEHYPQAIERLVDFTESMATFLDDLVISMLGEDAAWSNHVGVESIPLKYVETDVATVYNHKNKVWRLRKEANSLLLIETDHHVKEWAEIVSEVNETCKQQRKQLESQRGTIDLARKEITRLDKVITEMKSDVVNRFHSINILIATSIRNCDIGLSHWKRDERLKHLRDVVRDQIKEVQSHCHSYNDDF
ncbi:hypothetical protein PseudUWO311_00655 [Pseudanabaena sp. UWO311]|uniref:hypothetical protein n=1 Tax=Pseudanabaena sp. UWO311 TaxID=2487337 RepID=UPI0011599D5E|nr:hypothetical protein [Pseudanabaena sp. UWO311]TYQ29441.1 hypothetical protein PseudUWO311_00655 [Pseudanabaena sp. UWO311]